jgi:hypothetical protein
VQSALSRGVDLRSYAQQIEIDLNDAEMEYLNELLTNSEHLGENYTQLTNCDATLEKINDILTNFQTQLYDISHEIHSLQQLSVTLSVELCNRKSVYNRLSCYTKNTYLPPDLVNTICATTATASNQLGMASAQIGNIGTTDAPVTIQMANYLQTLTNIVLFHSLPQIRLTQPAVDMIPVLHHVYSRAIIRSRNSLMGWINELKKPTVNIFVKQTRLLRYRQCYDFLLLHCGSSFVDELTRVSYGDELITDLTATGSGNNSKNNPLSNSNVIAMNNPMSTTATTTTTIAPTTTTTTTTTTIDSTPFAPNSTNVSVVTMESIENYIKQLGDLSQEVRNFYVSVMSFVYFQHFKTYTNTVLKLQSTHSIQTTQDDFIGGEHTKSAQLQYQTGIDPHNSTQNQQKGSWFKLSWGSSGEDKKKAAEKPQITPDFFSSPSLYFRPNEFDAISTLLFNHNKLITVHKRNLANQFQINLEHHNRIPFELYNIMSLLSFSQTTMSLSTLPSIRSLSMGQKDVVLALQLDNIVLPAVTNQTNQQIAAGQPAYLSINMSLLPPSALGHNQDEKMGQATSTVSKLPFERLFRSALHLLIDTCITEYTFIHQFFGVSTIVVEQGAGNNHKDNTSNNHSSSTIRKDIKPSPKNDNNNNIHSSNNNNQYIAHIFDSIFEQQAEEEIEYQNLQQLLHTIRSNNPNDIENDENGNNINNEKGKYLQLPKRQNENLSDDFIRNLLVQCQDRITTLSSALLPYRVQQGFTQFSLVFQRIFQFFIDVLDQYTSQCFDIVSLLILAQIIYIYDKKISNFHIVSSVSIFLTKLIQLLLKRVEFLMDQQVASIRYVIMQLSQDLDSFQQLKTDLKSGKIITDPKAITIYSRFRGYISHIILITYKHTELIAAIRKLQQFYITLNISPTTLPNQDQNQNQLHDGQSALPNMILELEPYVLQLSREFEILLDSSRDVIAQISFCHSFLPPQQPKTVSNTTHNIINIDNSKADANILVNMFNTHTYHLILSILLTRQQNMISISPPQFSHTNLSEQDLPQPSLLLTPEFKHHKKSFLNSLNNLADSILRKFFSPMLDFVHTSEGYLDVIEKGNIGTSSSSSSSSSSNNNNSNNDGKQDSGNNNNHNNNNNNDENKHTLSQLISFAQYFIKLNENDDAGFDSVAKQFFVTQQQWKDSLLSLLLESEALSWSNETSKLSFTQISIAMSMSTPGSNSNNNNKSQQTPTNRQQTNPSSSSTTTTTTTTNPTSLFHPQPNTSLSQYFNGEDSIDIALSELIQLEFGQEDIGSLITNIVTKRFLIYFVRYTDILKRGFEIFKKSSIATILQSNSVDVGRVNIIKTKLQEYSRRTVTIHSLVAEIKKYNKASNSSSHNNNNNNTNNNQ